MANSISPELIARSREIKSSFGTEDSVFYIDIGYRWRTDGTYEDDVCIRVHCCPPKSQFKELEDVQFIYYPSTGNRNNRRKDPTSYRDPIQPGASIGTHSESGTLGLFCRDLEDPNQAKALLTCYHVVKGKIGYNVYSPAFRDASGSIRICGKLKRFLSNSDLALVHLNKLPDKFRTEIRYTGISLKGIRSSRLGEILFKSGRSTGLTHAKVNGIRGTFYERRCKNQASRKSINHCIRLVPQRLPNTAGYEISLPGDSGSIWYHPVEMTGAGLHFAGEATANNNFECAFAQDLSAVFRELNIELITDNNEILFQPFA